ncbi:MAG: single-stranded-DNA-specific exonuclease RecJ [Saccharofermentans sp.]|nr:single-stranded-DNA-specific exonuclease RecJ [Saccharofermentans sp.]
MLLTSKKWKTAVSFDKEYTDALISELLRLRQIDTPEKEAEFLLDDGGMWNDPFLFNDMRKAVDIVCETLDKNGKILVYGDYDCDGVTATSIMVRYFRSHEAKVDYIVPHRAEHGYGLTENILDKVLEHAPDLLITVDCGITNIDAVKCVKEHGIKVIVSDHHNVKEELPDADALICSKINDNTYPYKELCGAGVALKIVEAMGRDGRYKVSGSIWRQSLELAGIATIADLVPVTGENRTIIKKAFKSMANPINPGVRIMNEIILDHGKKLDETFISFNFVPRINAAGRLYDSSDALKLFLSDDEKAVKKAAEALGKQNDERKLIESEVFTQAVKQIESPDRPEEWLITNTVGPIVAYGSKWHQGVLGIVAGKLAAYYRRPAIVFTDDSIDSGNVKGSGRAYGEFDLFEAIEHISDKCVGFGGHKKAAGLVVEKARLKEFMKALEDNAKEALSEDKDSKDEDEDFIEIDADIPFEQVTFATYEKTNVLKPFGIGNKKPVFSTRNLIVTDAVAMSDGAHIRLELCDGREEHRNGFLSAVGFNMGQYLDVIKPGDRVDIAYTMNEFTYRGNVTLSLCLEDIKPIVDSGFMWQKNDIAEELYRSGMPLSQIEKLAKRTSAEAFIPSKTQYAQCYKVLSSKCGNTVSTMDTVLAAKMIWQVSGVEITPFQVSRCLDVFSEAGIMKRGKSDSDKVCFSFIKNDGKVSLTSSETYMRLNADE